MCPYLLKVQARPKRDQGLGAEIFYTNQTLFIVFDLRPICLVSMESDWLG